MMATLNPAPAATARQFRRCDRVQRASESSVRIIAIATNCYKDCQVLETSNVTITYKRSIQHEQTKRQGRNHHGVGERDGRATAVRFAGEGAKIVIADLNKEGGEAGRG
jgi:hypothetical protein